MTEAPILKHIDDLTTHRIAPGDTVKLAHLTGPSEGSPTSVFFEIWDPQGVQPDNSHPDSVEIFIFLNGVGRAVSDEHTVDVRAGDVLVLPSGSVHHIENTSTTERLYAVTIMANDLGSMEKGFEDLVTTGTPEVLDAADKAAIFTGLAAIAGR
ncbi:cupin domain-containing protein [Plantibacter sp. Mn2098]|uniref:cupin domain-containing protein n=1 Tax=Plantibacter sp. Mn2098 TaxID=3395266 RepID=UPI003BCFD0E6